ncbi:MAG: hypothetical protein M1834_001648 [Cirrosporium novae-zelandiae]|nr:MAG: hypothetical protein M1834_004165 [Cirrosporium novae-zelandiae]KAI9735632.1 MAG: hypothetical protein M1834_001648 [Cirrosporium novae-zelandiae]
MVVSIQTTDVKILEALADLVRLKAEFIKNRVVFVKSDRMLAIVKALGATELDIEKIKHVSDGLSSDPTLPFRKSKNGRFCFDFEKYQVRRLEFQPFVLSAEENFVRHDSGQTRMFEEVGNDLQLNSVQQALFIFKTFMLQGVSTIHRPKLDYDCHDFICTLFNLRTVTNEGMVGEPALEGVHEDGVDFTMTTYLGSENMTADSAITFVHDVKEKNGLRWNETNPDLALGSVQHTQFLDTLLFADHERKHSLSPVTAVDPTKPATRDMLIFFTRKPVVKGHVSYPYDSLKPHPDLKMEINL